MRFWNYKSDEFYKIYTTIYDSNFPIEKKKVILTFNTNNMQNVFKYALQRIS